MDTRTATPIPKSHPIHPAPQGVNIDQATHALLIIQMAAGNRIAATDTAKTIARTARNTLLTAYTPWIIHLATFGRQSLGSDDRAGQALMACVEVIGNYDPTTNVPLQSYLRANAAIAGQAVAVAGMPADQLNQKQRRHAVKKGIPIDRPMSLSTPIGNDGGLSVADLLPGERYSRGEEAFASGNRVAIANELEKISEFHRGLLVDRLGLEGGVPRSLKDLATARGITVRAAGKAVNRAETALAAAAPNLRRLLERADHNMQAAT